MSEMQVWAVVYDGDPMMDGTYARRQIGTERLSLQAAQQDVDTVVRRRGHSPLPGLRIETRMVSPWVRI